MLYRIFIALALLLPSVVSAAVIETNEWENLTRPNWAYGGHPVSIDCAITPSPSGNCALKFTFSAGVYPPTQSFSGGLTVYTLPAGITDLYLGAWMRYSSPATFHPLGQKMNQFAMDGAVSSTGFPNNIQLSWLNGASTISGTQQIVWGDGSLNHTCNVNNFSGFTDAWKWVEFHVQLNTPGQANGVYDAWVDGIQCAHYTNISIRDNSTPASAGWANLHHTAEWGGGGGTIDTTFYWWVDHTVISTTPIGVPGGAPPVGDTIAPSMPTGLTATVSGSSQNNLAWTASTDTGGSGLAGYNLRVCTGAACTPVTALAATTVPTVAYVHSGLTASTVYGYSVNAYDNAGNQSAYTATQYATTSATGALGTITFDAVANSPDNETLDNTSWTHTVGAGDNRYLLVCLQARGTVAGSVLATTVNRGGVGLTKIRADNYPATGAYYQTELWGQVAPTVGAGTVAVTWAGAPTEFAVGSSTSYLGVHQSTPIEAQAGGSGNSATASVSVTTLTANAWLSDCAVGRNDLGLTVGAGQTARVDRLVGNVELTIDGAGVSTVDGKASPGAETMDWTQTSSDWVMSAVALKPAAASVAPSITGAVADATGADLTFGATVPTTVRVQTNLDSLVYTVATIAGGRTSVGSDTFTRGDSADLGTNWTPWSQTIAVASNTAQATVTGSTMREIETSALTADHWAQATLSAFGGSTDAYAGVMVRANAGTSSTYACVAARGTFVGTSLLRRVNLVQADLATDTSVWAPGDTIRLEVQGSALRCYRNGTLILSTTDTSLSSGSAGLWARLEAGGTLTDVRLDEYASGIVTPLDTTGRFSRVWTPDLTSATFYARDAAGNETSAAGSFQTVTLSGVVAADTAAPTLSGGSPSSTLPQGTTSTNMTALASEPVVCRYSTTDQAYSAMSTSNQMTVINRTASVNLTGLTDGSSTVYYIACQDLATSPNETATRLAVTVAVAAAPAADTTAPSTPLNFLCTALSQTQASCTWDLATDNVAIAGYYLYLCGGTSCSSFSQVGTIIGSTTIIVDLSGATAYTMKVKAVDTSNNLSASFSNASTITTNPVADLVPPSTMTGLTATPYVNSVVLSWAQGFDNLSFTTAVIERCAGAACVDFTQVLSVPLVTSYVHDGLTAATLYRFRGRHADQANNMSASYSNIVEVTTGSAGLARPRLSAAGTDSVPVERSTATTRTPR